MSFSPFLCLPVMLKLNGLPKLPKTPQLPSRETLGDSTQLHFLPRLSCGQSSQSQPSVLRFPNLNIPRRSFRWRAPVEANASAVRLWGRQWSTGGGGVEENTPPFLDHMQSSPEWRGVFAAMLTISAVGRSFGTRVWGWGSKLPPQRAASSESVEVIC